MEGEGRGGKGREEGGIGRKMWKRRKGRRWLFTVVVSGGVQRAHSPHFSS